MSGHSKWANIKRKKEANDLKRGKIFSKLSRIISIAVREGGGIKDPEKNIKLRIAIARAKSENMPKENIERAIERASKSDIDSLSEVVYEAFGPKGVAIIIPATTDNANRTHSEIRNILEKNGGKLASTGAVSHLFEKCGIVIFDSQKVTENQVLDFVGQINAFDLEEEGGNYFVYIPFEKLGVVDEVSKSLQKESVDLFYKPVTYCYVTSEDAQRIELLVEKLEELDDVEKVFTNYEIADSKNIFSH